MSGLSNRATNVARAIEMLRRLGKEPYDFQAHIAADCIRAIEAKEKVLVVAPTGAGKTLISNLIVSLLGQEHTERFPRALVVVPSRSLLIQHVEDASWLRVEGIPIHRLSADTPFSLYKSIVAGGGVMYTTPITLIHRLQYLERTELLGKLDCAIFDEIDTYLTTDELRERKDTWLALQHCLDAGIATFGFTGTVLSKTQWDRWINYGFKPLEAQIPDHWMPFTIVQFARVIDGAVRKVDEAIRDGLREAYGPLLAVYGTITLAQVKRLAQEGNPFALQILKLCGERLKLFETLGPDKRRFLLEACGTGGPTLVLSRYILSADHIKQELDTEGIAAAEAHGNMTAGSIGAATNWFRALASDEQGALVITRELGGRGLDFPTAQQVYMVSPRSNYQAVAQELARIRSRRSAPKRAIITYYDGTAEQVKAQRLGIHLRGVRFGDHHLFQVDSLPEATYPLESFESKNLRYEEGLIVPH